MNVPKSSDLGKPFDAVLDFARKKKLTFGASPVAFFIALSYLV